MQRLLDDYTLKQAQAVLKLSDAQVEQFQPRMRALQDTRRRNQMARMRALRALADAAGAGEDAAIRARLQALQEHDARAAIEVQEAYAAIDAVLNLPQQARFRVFEDTMERRKLELMMRARQGRAARTPRKPS
jgi:Spy/CpxP family protein refolding chaperone